MLKPFKIQNIEDLDSGRIAATINKSLRSAVEDCANRPGVDSARTVTVQIELRPVIDEDGVCTETALDVVSRASLPKHRSKTISMGVRPKGMLVFNTASEDSVRQTTLDQATTGPIEPTPENDE